MSSQPGRKVALRLPRWHPATVLAYGWGRLALALLHRRWTRRSGTSVTSAADVITVPPLPAGAVRGLESAIARGGGRCLARALLLQAWHARHGVSREVVIGVTATQSPLGFRAHAWLDGDPSCHDHDFVELSRR
jgi:hypothetical protein